MLEALFPSLDEMLLQRIQLQGEDIFIEARLMMVKPSAWLHVLI